MTPLDIGIDHSAPGRCLRQRLRETLDCELIGDGSDLDKSNDAAHPDNQAVYVEFGGEDSGFETGLNHRWNVWIVQRRDYPDWEKDYGCLRASLICALDGWQPGTDVKDLQLLRDECGIEDYPGLRIDLTVWRVSELTFI